jgi:hypothetical protein
MGHIMAIQRVENKIQNQLAYLPPRGSRGRQGRAYLLGENVKHS